MIMNKSQTTQIAKVAYHYFLYMRILHKAIMVLNALCRHLVVKNLLSYV